MLLGNKNVLKGIVLVKNIETMVKVSNNYYYNPLPIRYFLTCPENTVTPSTLTWQRGPD